MGKKKFFTYVLVGSGEAAIAESFQEIFIIISGHANHNKGFATRQEAVEQAREWVQHGVTRTQDGSIPEIEDELKERAAGRQQKKKLVAEARLKLKNLKTTQNDGQKSIAIAVYGHGDANGQRFTGHSITPRCINRRNGGGHGLPLQV